MRKIITFFALTVAAMLCLFPSISNMAAENDDLSNARPGELLIQLFKETDIQDLTEQFKTQSLKPVKCLSKRMNVWLFEFEFSNLKSSEQVALLNEIKESDLVSLAQFNHYVSQRQTIPNDTYFGNQWGLHNTGQSGGTVDADIDAPEAWDMAIGDSTVLGDQIVVAIIDGGFDLNHTDISYFKNTLEINGNGIDDDGNGYIDDYNGWNAYSHNGNIPSDDHGTHTAGIAAAKGNNNAGVSGVNMGAKVMPVAGSSSNEATVVEAYGYVLEMRSRYNETNGAEGAFVVSTNSSFGVDYGNPVNYPVWCAFYDSLGAAGILSAAATANINLNVDVSGDVPTACASDFLISVTNTTRYDTKNSGAAYGLTTIDLGAPGTTVYSTLPGSSYGNMTGTSMATPHVCGAVGLLWSAACSNFINDYYDDPSSSALLMKQYILNGVDPISDLTGTTVSGGRLNVYNSMLLVLDYLCGINISHAPLTDTRDYQNDYEIVAEISSDTSLVTASLLLYYRTGGSWLSENLQPTGNPDEYSAFIPAQSPGSLIEYYLYGEDEGGNIDSTEVYSFRVIDYAFTLMPDYQEITAAANSSVWYDFQIQNVGVYDDNYLLTTSNNIWNTTFYDETGMVEITSTGLVSQDLYFNFKVKVEVPTSYYGQADSCVITVASSNNGDLFFKKSIKTTSMGEPLQLPFLEEFISGLFDPGHWLNTTTATISIQAAAPSPFVVNLDGNPSGSDTIITHIMNLNGLSEVSLSYYYARTLDENSPEAGDDLFFEYKNNIGEWVLISQQYGDGPDMTAFEFVEVNLPMDAYHAAFQLRIRNIGTPGTAGTYDDWFVDDISVSANYICGDINNDGTGPVISDLTYLVDFLFAGGPPPPVVDASDVNNDGSIGISDITYLVAYLFQGGLAPICN